MTGDSIQNRERHVIDKITCSKNCITPKMFVDTHYNSQQTTPAKLGKIDKIKNLNLIAMGIWAPFGEL
jgi:hypothetical protein